MQRSVRAVPSHGECGPLHAAHLRPSRPCVDFLAFEGLLGEGCARDCPSRPLESPDSSSGGLSQGPGNWEGVDLQLGVLRRTLETSLSLERRDLSPSACWGYKIRSCGFSPKHGIGV